MDELLRILVGELERPRELTPQVLRYIGGTYSVDADGLSQFFSERILSLEDYEIDLILSPLFTPRLKDQAIFGKALGSVSLPRERWPEIIQQLVDRPTYAHLVDANGVSHSTPLREVTTERYVHRLRLEGSIENSTNNLIGERTPAADRSMLNAVARRAIWEQPGRRNILEEYLKRVGSDYKLNDVVELLGHVENYQPADAAQLLSQLPHFKKLLQHEIDTTGGSKPFFSPRILESHGGERDQRSSNDSALLTAKQEQLAFLERLERLFN